MLTFTAIGGAVAFRKGMQYQHSSYFMCALPVASLIQSTSSGQTSIHTQAALSARDFRVAMTGRLSW